MLEICPEMKRTGKVDAKTYSLSRSDSRERVRHDNSTSRLAVSEFFRTLLAGHDEYPTQPD